MYHLPNRIVVSLLAVLLSLSSAKAQDNIVLKNGTEIQARVLEVSPTQIKYRRQDNPDGPTYTTGTADVLLLKYANGTKDVLGNAPTRPGLMSLPPLSAPALGTAPTMTIPATGLDGLRYHGGLFSRHFTNGAGNRLYATEVRSLLMTQPDALSAFDRGRSLRRLSVVAAVGTVALLGTGIGLALADGNGMGHGEQLPDNADNGSDQDTDGQMDTNGPDNHNGDGAVVGYALAGSGVLLGLATVWLDHRATVQFRRAADRYNTRPAASLRFSPSQRGLGLALSLTF